HTARRRGRGGGASARAVGERPARLLRAGHALSRARPRTRLPRARLHLRRLRLDRRRLRTRAGAASLARGHRHGPEGRGRARAQPGVESASLVRFTPLGFSYAQGQVVAEGRPTPRGEEATSAGFNVVGPDYFKTMGAPLVRGREFTESDGEGAPRVTVVNEALA